MDFSRNDYKILLLLLEEGKTDKRKAMTLNEIQGQLKSRNIELSIVKIRLTISTFNKIGYVDEGLKAGKRGTAKTYFITPEGIKALK